MKRQGAKDRAEALIRDIRSEADARGVRLSDELARREWSDDDVNRLCREHYRSEDRLLKEYILYESIRIRFYLSEVNELLQGCAKTAVLLFWVVLIGSAVKGFF
jgi:hypothetical protein